MFYIILVFHWFADFVCQTRQMANNKSKSSYWLGYHILVYSIIMSIFGWRFALINGLAHFITDFCTSKGTSFFWKKQNIHAFFVVIGFDQLLHIVILYWSYPYANCYFSRIF